MVFEVGDVVYVDMVNFDISMVFLCDSVIFILYVILIFRVRGVY